MLIQEIITTQVFNQDKQTSSLIFEGLPAFMHMQPKLTSDLPMSTEVKNMFYWGGCLLGCV